MEQGEAFRNLTDWVAITSMAFMLVVLYGGWLTSYRIPKAAPVGRSLWFRLPAWGQIVGGLMISVVGAYFSYLLWIPLPFIVSQSIGLALRIGGLILLIGGTLLFLWAKQTLGIMYSASTSSAVQLNADHRLIQHGPFALVRHPIYLSYWLILAGLFVAYRTWMPLFLLVMMMIALFKRAHREEQVLEDTFGAIWKEYAKQVPMFIPRWRGVQAFLPY